MKGWVFVISNTAMPGLLYVGASQQDPDQSAAAMSHPGVPHPYTVDYEALVHDPEQIATETLEHLSVYAEGNAWFRSSHRQVVKGIRSVAGNRLIHDNVAEGVVISEPEVVKPAPAAAAVLNTAAQAQIAEFKADLQPKTNNVTPLVVSPNEDDSAQEAYWQVPAMSPQAEEATPPPTRALRSQNTQNSSTSVLLNELMNSPAQEQETIPEPYIASNRPIAAAKHAAKELKHEQEEKLYERRRQHEAEEIQARYKKKMRKYEWPLGLLFFIYLVVTAVATFTLLKLQGSAANSGFMSCYFSANFFECYFGHLSTDFAQNPEYFLLKLRDAAAYAVLPSLLIYWFWISLRKSGSRYKKLKLEKEHELSMIGY